MPGYAVQAFQDQTKCMSCKGLRCCASSLWPAVVRGIHQARPSLAIF